MVTLRVRREGNSEGPHKYRNMCACVCVFLGIAWVAYQARVLFVSMLCRICMCGIKSEGRLL